MIKWLKRYVGAVDWVNRQIGNAVKWFTIAVVSILLFEATSRYAFNRPPTWTLDLAMFIFLGGSLLGGGFSLLRERHVRMDALYVRWSPRKRAIMDIATFVLFVSVLIMAWNCSQHTFLSFIEGERGRTIWRPPIWPIEASITVAAFLLFFQATGNLIRDVFIVFRGEPLE